MAVPLGRSGSAAATIVSGGVAERVNFGGYCLYSFLMTAAASAASAQPPPTSSLLSFLSEGLCVPGHCRMDLGLRMACIDQQRGLHGCY